MRSGAIGAALVVGALVVLSCGGGASETPAFFPADAERLAFRWLSMIVRNAAEHHGTVPEKSNVKNQSHRVFAEYGNVNTTFSYIADEGFGWMNASFVVGYHELDDDARAALGE